MHDINNLSARLLISGEGGSVFLRPYTSITIKMSMVDEGIFHKHFFIIPYIANHEKSMRDKKKGL